MDAPAGPRSSGQHGATTTTQRLNVGTVLFCLTPGVVVVPLSAFRVLLENDEDRLLVVFNRGLILMTEVRSGSRGYIRRESIKTRRRTTN